MPTSTDLPLPKSSKGLPWLPLAAALFFYWLLTLALAQQGMQKTDGLLIYPLDDTYIHMAISRHFAQDGAWSVHAGSAFTSTTSSPLWTLLLSGVYAIFGVSDPAPLWLNLLFGSAALALAASVLRKTRPLLLTLYLLLLIFFMPLPAITLVGMEHTLHTWLTVWLIFAAARLIAADASPSPHQLAGAMLLAALTCAARYEGLFLVAAIGLFLLHRRRVWPAVLIGLAGFLPLGVYGLISVANGWDFLPASLAMKGNAPSLSAEGLLMFFSRLPVNLLNAVHTLILLIVCLLIVVGLEARKVPARLEKTLLGIFILTSLLHLLLASVGWFYRYESYLIFTGCAVALYALRPLLRGLALNGRGKLAALALALLLAFPLAWRGMRSIIEYPTASANIYHQQYQMALFLRQYYNGGSVVANDIGAINYLADLRLLDLYGLGSLEVTHARRGAGLTEETLNALAAAQNPNLAIVYADALEGFVPQGWLLAGSWIIPHSLVVPFDTVLIYAPDAARLAPLTKHLREFAPRLPQGVRFEEGSAE